MVAITVIGKSNGVGLARDLRLLAEALQQCGCRVEVYPAERRDARKRRSVWVQTAARAGAWLRRRSGSERPEGGAAPIRHVNLMLEHVWPQFLGTADLNIAVPNPEWFDRRDQRLLAALDGVWAKTHHTQQVFAGLGCRTQFIGFDSDDRYDASVPRERTFFHLAGKSRLKGTAPLLELWLRHPEWPRLTLVYHERGAQVPPAVAAAANIVWYRDYLPDEQLRRLQNASCFHLCLSEAEGWGHYIVEAMSVGAVTLTLDAAPMNELIQPDRGLLLPRVAHGHQHLADTFGFEAAALEGAIERALWLEEPQLARLGQTARAWFLENRRGFPARLRRALGTLESRPATACA